MKKTLLIIFIIAIVTGINFAGTITVTSPNGGENWVKGDSHNITWSASDLTNDLKITLWKGEFLIGLIAKDINPSSGSYSWTVGDLEGGTVNFCTSGYKIKIREQGGPSFTTTDMSNSTFSILISSPDCLFFEVYKPAKHSSHWIGYNMTIKWGKLSRKAAPVTQIAPKPKIGKVKMVKIEISKYGIGGWLPIATTKDDGSYIWKVPSHYIKGYYEIRVSKLWCVPPNLYYGATSGNFELIPPPNPMEIKR